MEAAVDHKLHKISVTNLSGGRLADPASESGIEVLRCSGAYNLNSTLHDVLRDDV